MVVVCRVGGEGLLLVGRVVVDQRLLLLLLLLQFLMMMYHSQVRTFICIVVVFK